jgi:hypothetical protein
MKKTFGLAAAAVLTFALSACGDDNGGDGGSGGYDEAAYCDAYKSAESEFEDADFSQLDEETFGQLQDKVTEMREKAPEDLKDEWETFEGALDEFQTLLSDAGLSLEDLSNISDPSDLPEGVTIEDLQELGTKMQDFAENNDIQSATDAIEKDAETRCDIPAEGGES